MNNLSKKIDTKDVVNAFTKAVDTYGVCDGVDQRDLKPLSVLAVDYLTPKITRKKKPYISMNNMMYSKDKDRRWVSKNIKNLTEYPYECIVDLYVMTGEDHPYQTILTVESEGFSGHARELAKGEIEENDMLWDLHKLLIVPSPIRLFVTRSSSLHHKILFTHTTRLVNAYANAIGKDTSIFVVQIPTASLRNEKALIAGWKAGTLAKETQKGHHSLVAN